MKNKKLLWGVCVLLMTIAIFFGVKTPVTGEAQLIGKVLFLLSLCYCVIQFLFAVFSISSKQKKVSDFLFKILFFFFCLSVIVLLVNVPFDFIMSRLEGREIPNSGCTVIALVLFFIAIFSKKPLLKKAVG